MCNNIRSEDGRYEAASYSPAQMAGDRVMRTKAFRGPWSILGLLWIAFALNYVDRQIAYSIFPALRRGLGFNQVQLGLIGTVFLWTYAVSMLPAGRAADHLSRRALILASLGLWSVATAGCGLATSPAVFLCWRAVIAISEALYVPAALGMLAALHPDATRSTALSIHASAQVAGVVAGGWYGGWAADHIGWRAGFLAIAAAGLAYAVFLAFVLVDVPDGPTAKASPPAGLRDLLRSPCYVALCAAFFPFCATIWMFYTWLPDLLYARHGLSMERSGLIATASLQISSVIGILAGGRLADRLAHAVRPARLYVAGAGVVLSPGFYYLVFAASSMAGVQLCSVAFGLTAGLMMGNVFAAGYDALPECAYGIGAGVVNMCGALGGGLCVLLAGVARGSDGIQKLSAVTAALTAGAGLVMLLVVASQYGRKR